MATEHDIISDQALESIYCNADFGAVSRRQVLRLGVLKCASGFSQGHTSKAICEELGLIDSRYVLTGKGQRYLWAAFGGRTGN